MLDRAYTIHRDDQLTHCYSGFNANPIGAFFELRVLEFGPFYCTEKELSLAIMELVRYAADQYDREDATVQVLPLQPAWDTIEF